MSRSCILKTSAALLLLATASCKHKQPPASSTSGGLTLPAGFRASIFADDLGRGRHIIVRDNGDVYVSLRTRDEQRGGGIVALRDADRDGTADEIRYFGDVAGTGLDIRAGYLYFGEPTRIVRFKFESPEELVPSGAMEIVVDGFPEQGAHAAKPVTFDASGNLYVNIGVPSNACQESIRTPESPGRQPCDELEGRGIFVYDAMKTGQQHPDDGTQFATGLRQTVALEWNAHAKGLYLVMHGRDQLDTLFPGHFSASANAELPAEEMHLVERGLNAGWPYTYWDPRQNQRMVAPEYGGDGRTPAEPDEYATPIVAFPAHWAPNDLVFYGPERFGGSFSEGAPPFPDRYHHGAFIAFHGSWNRAPLPQQGYKVVFQPFSDRQPAGSCEDFATGFPGSGEVQSPRDANHRPCGLAVAPDGALFVVDSQRGRVWRIEYGGQ